ncbi:MAG: D-glycero-beta-D-manno-heptose 1,7-bisphosphate 7-phosphatase [Betaproteobacteria bacterium]|nr:D-glycero-beta-D-manno-heptose 1,7-bisphosphate 7-phosphatase [Betaproteobacteria bacterium]
MKLIVLDRDGVINHDSAAFIKSPGEWRPLPGSLNAISRLNQAGFHVIVATNQSGIGRGFFDMAALNAIHDKMHKALAQAGARVDAVFFCPHTVEDGCQCRKPKTGMYDDIARRLNTKLAGVLMVGDSIRDLEAAAAVQGQPLLVLTGNGKKTQRAGNLPPGTRVYADLAAAVDTLVE